VSAACGAPARAVPGRRSSEPVGPAVRRLAAGALLLVAVAGPPGMLRAHGADAPAGEERAAAARAAGIAIPAPAPDRPAGEGRGPFPRLVVRDVMLIDGTGAPRRGPVDVVVEGERIAAIRPAGRARAADDGAEVLDGSGLTALPGLIDAHAHTGNPMQGLAGPVVPPEYVFKLWLGHGITTIRDPGSTMGLRWTVAHKERSAAGVITAPYIVAHAMFPGRAITSAEGARRWVQAVRRAGADGVKLRGATPEATAAIYDETRRLGMTTSNHHDQTSVYTTDALDSARMGLSSLEHWYGLPEALFTDRTIQDYPPDYDYSDEQWRFAQAGRLWHQAAEPGSPRWNAVRDELIEHGLVLVPTFTIYEANRDVMRARRAEWHDAYTLPALERFYRPDPEFHGSYHFDWTTADEIAWRRNFERWMRFVNDYKNHGGRVAAGSDAGFIFKLYGFAYVRELELLQEAGFHPLEVIQAATRNGADLLGLEGVTGSIVPGLRADLILVDGNPAANFKRLYGTGHLRLDRTRGELVRTGGVLHTIRGGIVFDAAALRADVRDMVRRARADEARAAAAGARDRAGTGAPAEDAR
jgi:hypothetical protein